MKELHFGPRAPQSLKELHFGPRPNTLEGLATIRKNLNKQMETLKSSLWLECGSTMLQLGAQRNVLKCVER